MKKTDSVSVRGVDKETRDRKIANSEAYEVVVFDEDAFKAELDTRLTNFGIEVCQAGKRTLAPLGKSFVEYLFSWLETKIRH